MPLSRERRRPTRRTAAMLDAAALALALAVGAAAAPAPELPTGIFEVRDGLALACGSPFGCSRGVVWGSLELADDGAGTPRVRRFRLSFSDYLVAPFDTTAAEVRPGETEGHWRLSLDRVFDFDLFAPSADSRWLKLSGLRTSTCFDANCGGYLTGVLLERVDGEPAPLRLLDGRFEVRVDWRAPGANSGSGHPQRLGDRAGKFWFFRSNNPELLVKMVPACGPFGHNWFFAAGLTDVGVTIRVTDTATGVERLYENPLGHPFEPIQDTRGFPCE